MATAILSGQTTWSMTRDEESHRTYKITFRVRGLKTDGPANVLQTPGLPVYGSTWDFDGDFDIWAWCRWDADVKPTVEGEPNTEWTVTFTFSTKPPKCCRENQVEDPLLEPMVISGGSNKYTEEATIDRFGDRVLNSAFEQIRGPQNEWDNNRSTIKIVQNVPDLEYDLCRGMVNAVNDSILWDMPPRTVKLANFNFERKFYGNCNVYYTRTFEFETTDKGWDRDVLDEGNKALNGHHDPTTGEWVLDDINGEAPDPSNPAHFRRYKDRNGENTTVILDGHGVPYVPTLPPPEEKWWATGATLIRSVFQSGCASAVEYAKSFNFKIAGPYDTEKEAQSVADDEDFYEAFGEDPDEFTCPDDSAPGSVHLEVYDEVNLLLLGIPTSF